MPLLESFLRVEADGSGSARLSFLNRQSAAVEIERGRTAASENEREEGILETVRLGQEV
jgi:hypothetical protein